MDNRLQFPDENPHYWRNLGLWAFAWLILLLATGVGVLVAERIITG